MTIRTPLGLVLCLLLAPLACGGGGDGETGPSPAGASPVDGGVGAGGEGGAVADGGGAGPDGAGPADGAPAACTEAPHTPGGSDGKGGCWPYAGNTGVPAGVTLRKYDGPCTLRASAVGPKVVLDGVDATACGILAVYDVAVEIRNSVVPVVDRTNQDGSVDIRDSEARGPGWVGGVLWGSNLTATRVEVTGGQHSVHCESNCTVVDSWLHGQEAPPGSETHNNAFISNGGSKMVVRHTSLFCSPADNGSGGGCTADASVFGDFAKVEDVRFEDDLFVATPSGGYCGTFGHNPGKRFGDDPTNVRVAGNVFQRGPNRKCGVFGPTTSFLAANGNVFSGNVWDDGEAIAP